MHSQCSSDQWTHYLIIQSYSTALQRRERVGDSTCKARLTVHSSKPCSLFSLTQTLPVSTTSLLYFVTLHSAQMGTPPDTPLQSEAPEASVGPSAFSGFSLLSIYQNLQWARYCARTGDGEAPAHEVTHPGAGTVAGWWWRQIRPEPGSWKPGEEEARTSYPTERWKPAKLQEARTPRSQETLVKISPA